MNLDWNWIATLVVIIIVSCMSVFVFLYNDSKPVELTGMYVIQKYELADIENRIFDLERRLSEVEGE